MQVRISYAVLYGINLQTSTIVSIDNISSITSTAGYGVSIYFTVLYLSVDSNTGIQGGMEIESLRTLLASVGASLYCAIGHWLLNSHARVGELVKEGSARADQTISIEVWCLAALVGPCSC